MTGEYPEREIDHIDGNPSNNRFSNLRACAPSENMANRRVSSRSKTGLKGVSYFPFRRKWRARAQKNGKSIYLGLFDTKEEAYAAYCEAAPKIHGDFAHT